MKDEERGLTTENTENTEPSRCDVEDQRLLKRLNGAIDKNERLKEWIIQAFPIMGRAFSIVIQENRLNEIPGCRGILESCPIEIPYEIPYRLDAPDVSNQGWIPVEDRLPEWDEPVLVFHPAYFGQSRIKIAYINQIDKRGHGWDYMDGGDLRYGVTHWRPLPNPPMVEGGEGK